jgi:hypothetical protein
MPSVLPEPPSGLPSVVPARPRRARRRTWGALAPFLAPLVLSCGPATGAALLRIAPHLSPEMAAHLAGDSPNTFRRWARDRNPRDLQWARVSLMRSMPAGPDDFLEAEAVVLPLARRLVTILDQDLDVSFERAALDRYEASPLATRMKACLLLRKSHELAEHLPEDLSERAAAFKALIDEGTPYATVYNVGDPYGPYCEILPRLDRNEEMLPNLEQAVARALDYGDTALACQFLGMIGVHYGASGDDASMLRWWERAMELARLDGNWHEARMLAFEASYRYGIGDAAGSVALFRRAEERSRELGNQKAEIRFLFEKISKFSHLQCWDLVASGINRADLLLKHARVDWSPGEREQWEVKLDGLRILVAATAGRPEEAARLAGRVPAKVARWPVNLGRLYALLQTAGAYQGVGRYAEARALLESIIADGRERSVVEIEVPAQIELARCALAMDDTAAAVAALANLPEIRHVGPYAPLIARYDVLRSQLARRAGHPVEAAHRMVEAFERMEGARRESGGTPEGQLALLTAEPLRTEFHALCAGEPRAGYLFELAWNRFRLAGGRAGAPIPSEIALAFAESRPMPLPPLMAGDHHVVYRWQDDGVIRWAREGDTVIREVLAASPRDVAALVERMRNDLAAPEVAGHLPGAAIAARWHRLATTLLPAGLLADTGRARLLLSPDGPLTGLRFEALSTRGDAYAPLILDRDVAVVPWLADDDRRIAGRRRRPLIVTEPAYDAEARRRWSVLNESMPASSGEVAGFVAGATAPTVLAGAAATRAAVLAALESADEIDITGHFVTDPELPYVEYIPLAASPDDDGLLRMADIRDRRLDHADLVVLSGCGTGVGYRSGHISIPSLAEIFLEAGAARVISTGWSVRDADAAAVMRAFNQCRAAGTVDPVTALGDARRRLIAAGVPPSVWAAYTILTDRPDPNPAAEGPQSAWMTR